MIKMTTPSKTLILVRHAKSSWGDPSLGDEERPLNKRGHRDAPRMGQWMVERGLAPDLVISSPANRARTTAEYLAQSLAYAPDSIIIDRQLYFTGVHGMLRAIEAVDDGVGVLMMVGHNPVMTDVYNQLTGEQLWNLPTCGVGVIAFDMPSWGLVDSTSGRLLAHQTPKSLRSGES